MINHEEEPKFIENAEDEDELLLTEEFAVEEFTAEDEAEEIKPKQIEPALGSRANFYTSMGRTKEPEGAPVAVVGAGVVGGVLASLLSRAGEKVVCLSSPSGVQRIAAEGLSLMSPVYGEHSFLPEASNWLKREPKLVIVAPRATHLEVAMSAVHPARVMGKPIIVLTSGFEHTKQLRNDYGSTVAVAAMIPLAAYREDTNRITHENGRVRMVVAHDRMSERDRLASAVEILRKAGVDVEILPSEADVIWGYNVPYGIAALIVASGATNMGEALSDPFWLSRTEMALNEAARVAKAEGSKVDLRQMLDHLAKVSPSAKMTLVRDVAKGRLGELDYLIGGLLRLADKHELECPVIAGLVKKINDKAEEYYVV